MQSQSRTEKEALDMGKSSNRLPIKQERKTPPLIVRLPTHSHYRGKKIWAEVKLKQQERKGDSWIHILTKYT